MQRVIEFLGRRVSFLFRGLFVSMFQLLSNRPDESVDLPASCTLVQYLVWAVVYVRHVASDEAWSVTHVDDRARRRAWQSRTQAGCLRRLDP